MFCPIETSQPLSDAQAGLHTPEALPVFALQRDWPCFLILVVYLICVLAANPKGEFPLNDDWSYVRSAFAFGSGHGMRVDQWSAPSLVGQALYGGLLTRMFSPHFLVLRISTLFLSVCIPMLLWKILLRTGFRRGLASVMLLAWLFNPLQFILSFTFMTEIPFVFFLALAFNLYVLYLDKGKLLHLIFCAAVLGYGYLIRQTALLFILALLCSILLDFREPVARRVRRGIAAAAASGIFIFCYYLWILLYAGATAAVHRKFQLLSYLESRQIIGNSYGMLFYLVFMMLPVLIFLIPSASRLSLEFRWIVRLGVPALWCAIVLTGLWWFQAQYTPLDYLPSATYHARMPFLLNVLYDSGLGPVTLDPTYFGAPPTPVYPRVWYGITIIVALGAILAGTLCVFGLLRLRSLPLFPKRKPLIIFTCLSLIFLVVFEVIFSHIQEGGLFDRHILIVSFPFSLLLGILSTKGDENRGNRAGAAVWIPTGLACAALILFCIAATHDYMQWNRVRWDMGRELLARGVDPLTIVGGFEFNAWHNYDTFAARGNIGTVHHWWYDRRDYIISMAPLEGYRILHTRSYFSWVHRRPVNLYVIRDSRY
jgi:4-amino-4-deoxy-L-arabinose transferase-like glycosyltransferase